MTLLGIDDLEVSYGPVRALRGVSLAVGAGEIVGLIGANGAGKTTLLRSISGLIKAHAGRIHFQDRQLRGAGSVQIVNAGLAHVPEGRRVWPDMTVEENLMLGGVVCSRDEPLAERMRSVLRLFPEVGSRLQQKAGTLSGGEQQMLAIARGLMSRPTLLMLDEPSLGLAPVIVQRLKEIIQTLNRDGLTVLVSEQNARLTLGVCNRAYVLAQGTVVSSGTPAELLEHADLISAYLGESTTAAG
jgi:branched-chain amino acid transport system ATP-binding protein